MEEKYTLTKKKVYALFITIVMIINMFGVLNVQVQAEEVAEEAYFELSLLKPSTDPEYIETVYSPDEDIATYYYYWDYMIGQVESIEENQTKGVAVQLKVKGSSLVNEGVLSLKFNTSKLVPAYIKETRVGRPPVTTYSLEETNDCSKFITSGWSRCQGTIDLNNPEIFIEGSGGFIENGGVAITMTFKLKEGVDIEDITSDMFTVIPNRYNQTGLKLCYFDKNDQDIPKSSVGSEFLRFEGFKQGENVAQENKIESNENQSNMPQGQKITEEYDPTKQGIIKGKVFVPATNELGVSKATVRIFKLEDVDRTLSWDMTDRNNLNQFHEKLEILRPLEIDVETNNDGTFEKVMSSGVYTIVIDKPRIS